MFIKYYYQTNLDKLKEIQQFHLIFAGFGSSITAISHKDSSIFPHSSAALRSISSHDYYFGEKLIRDCDHVWRRLVFRSLISSCSRGTPEISGACGS